MSKFSYKRFNKDTVAKSLKREGGSVRAMAESLDISVATAYKYIKVYKLLHLKIKQTSPVDVEKIKDLYNKCFGNMSQMARELGISRQAMSKRMQRPVFKNLKLVTYPKNEQTCKLANSLQNNPEYFKKLYKKFFGNYSRIAKEFGFKQEQLSVFIRQVKIANLYDDYRPSKSRLDITSDCFNKLYKKYNGDIGILADVLKVTRTTIYRYIKIWGAKS